jgi:hypothetical protein
MNIQTYDISAEIIDEGDDYRYAEVSYNKDKEGEWVKHEDIKHLLELKKKVKDLIFGVDDDHFGLWQCIDGYYSKCFEKEIQEIKELLI